MFLDFLTTTLLLLSAFEPVHPLTRNDSVSSDLPSSSALIKIFRGLHVSPDRLVVCSQNADVIKRFVTQDTVSKTMTCNTEAATICSGNERLKAYNCSCKSTSPTYVASKRMCISNSWLRNGCTLRFGTWQHQLGWRWNGMSAPLLAFYLDDGYGITGAFNVSTREYQSCSLVNTTMLNDFGVWESLVYDPASARIFYSRRQFYISWSNENMDLVSKTKLRGRILRFLITCQPVEDRSQLDVVKEPYSSCLVFKVTGNFTHVDTKTKPPSSENSISITAVALGVTFAVLFIVVAVTVTIFLYRRRSGGRSIRQSFSVEVFFKKT